MSHTAQIQALTAASLDEIAAMDDNYTASALDDMRLRALAFQAAATLLETHDMTGISLDNYTGPKQLVNEMLARCGQQPFTPNGV